MFAAAVRRGRDILQTHLRLGARIAQPADIDDRSINAVGAQLVDKGERAFVTRTRNVEIESVADEHDLFFAEIEAVKLAYGFETEFHIGAVLEPLRVDLGFQFGLFRRVAHLGVALNISAVAVEEHDRHFVVLVEVVDKALCRRFGTGEFSALDHRA